MAAVAVVLPLLTEVGIPLLVKLFDKIFPPKSGAAKLPAVTEAAAAMQSALQQSGALTGTPLTGAQLTTAVQASVDKLKAQGVLNGAATVIDSVASGSPQIGDLLISIGNTLKAMGK